MFKSSSVGWCIYIIIINLVKKGDRCINYYKLLMWMILIYVNYNKIIK